MERRTNLGVYYNNEELGIPEDCYPLNFCFLAEGKERDATRKDKEGKVIGFVKPCYPGALDGHVIFVQDGLSSVETVHRDTVVYERKT